MTYKIVYSKPRGDGKPLMSTRADKASAMALAESLRASGYIADVWEYSEDCARKVIEFREMLEQHGISQSECARRFGIPLRTVQDWATDRRACPAYTLRMIERLLELDKAKTEE